MGTYLTKRRRHSGHAGYSLYMKPQDRSFMAGSIYQPNASILKNIYQDIDYQVDTLITIINTSFSKGFRDFQGDKLKKIPRGYQANHLQIK